MLASAGFSEAPKALLTSNPALVSWILHPTPHGRPRASPSSWATVVRRVGFLGFWKSLVLLEAEPSRPKVYLQWVLLPTPPPTACLEPPTHTPSSLDLHLCPPHSPPIPKIPPSTKSYPRLQPPATAIPLHWPEPPVPASSRHSPAPPGGRPSSSPTGSASRPHLWPPPLTHPTIYLNSLTASPAPSWIFEDTWAPQGAPFVW